MSHVGYSVVAVKICERCGRNFVRDSGAALLTDCPACRRAQGNVLPFPVVSSAPDGRKILKRVKLHLARDLATSFRNSIGDPRLVALAEAVELVDNAWRAVNREVVALLPVH